MKKIPLTQGYFALVDDSDYEAISKYKWHIKKHGRTFYAKHSTKKGDNRKQKTVYMHSLLLATPRGMEVDHIDGDGLNNRRDNIRVCVHAENTRNARTRLDNKSGFRGVHFHSRDMVWSASIGFKNKRVHLGYFSSKLLAREAYRDASIKYYGNFARV